MFPKPIKKFDCIGIISISGPVDQQLLLDGLRKVHYMGFDSLTGPNIFKKKGYLAGTDSERVSDLNKALADPHIHAIIFARGGYGAMRILDHVDLAAISVKPKILVGMSDLTALSLSLFKRTGLITFAGPMIATENGVNLDKISHDSLVGALTHDCRGTELIPHEVCATHTIRSGKATGRLLGGCLSIVTALLGTEHLPNFSNEIMFLEEVNEPLYRIDRMLMQLKLNGIFNRLGGLVLGHFIGPNGENQRHAIENLILEVTGGFRFPIVSGFPHGHKLPNLSLPHGAIVDLDAEISSLIVRRNQF